MSENIANENSSISNQQEVAGTNETSKPIIPLKTTLVADSKFCATTSPNTADE